MPLTETEIQRLNLVSPATNDIGLGDIIAGILEGGAEGPQGPPGETGPQGPAGEDGQDGQDAEPQFTPSQVDALLALIDEGGD